MNDFIKGCPFCDSHEVKICRTNKDACWIECALCGGGSLHDETREGAIKNWNRRYDDDVPAIIVDDMDADFPKEEAGR